MSLIPGLGRSPGGGHKSPIQYSSLENPHGPRSLVGYSPQGCKESDITVTTLDQHCKHKGETDSAGDTGSSESYNNPRKTPHLTRLVVLPLQHTVNSPTAHFQVQDLSVLFIKLALRHVANGKKVTNCKGMTVSKASSRMLQTIEHHTGTLTRIL